MRALDGRWEGEVVKFHFDLAKFPAQYSADGRRSPTDSHDDAVSPHQRRTVQGRAVTVPAWRFLRDIFRGRPDRGANPQFRPPAPSLRPQRSEDEGCHKFRAADGRPV